MKAFPVPAPKHNRRNARRGGSRRQAQPSSIALASLGGNRFALKHPPCVRERWEDYLEGLEAMRMGAVEEAQEVFRFALEGCGDNLFIHAELGKIALGVDGNPKLARAHFGYVVELAMRAVTPGTILPPEHPDNAPLYEAIDGLIELYTRQQNHQDLRELDALRVRLKPAKKAANPDGHET